MASVNLKHVFPSLPKTERGKPIVINGDPKGENFLYTNGNSVFIRDINDPKKCDIYSDHMAAPTMAKYSPSRFYIASGDVTGKVRIWDTVNPEHICKNEFQPLSSTVKDIDWAPDNTKIVVVGEGNSSYATVITADSGNTVGSLAGHNKAVNSAAYRPNRPFRLVTASEDFRTQFYEGPPFKYKEQHLEHKNFVNCVRYQPGSGDVYITGGADGQALIYDGKTSEFKCGLGGEKAHNGGIYALCFSPNGDEVLTVSGDKTAKIWNVATQELVVQFTLGKEIDDMQVGCLWQGDNIMTVSLSGYINYLDRNNPESPIKILKGHNKAITAMAITSDKSRIYTGDPDGKIMGWEASSGMCEKVNGKGHTNLIKDMAIVEDSLITVSWDDTIRYTSLSSNQYGNSTSLPSQPTYVAATQGGIAVVTCLNHLVVVVKGNIMFQQEVKFEPVCVDISPCRTVVAIGGKADHHLHIFDFDGSTLKGKKKLEFSNDDVTDVKFSPDGAYLAVTTGTLRQTYLFDASNYEKIYQIGKQTGRIFTLAWNPNSQYFATGSLDGSIVIWCLDPSYTKSCACYLREAHKKGDVKKLHWLSDNLLVSAGNDSCVKQWEVKF